MMAANSQLQLFEERQETLSAFQLRSLHSLFSLCARRLVLLEFTPSVSPDSECQGAAGEAPLPSPSHELRAQRLAWASRIVGRVVTSFSNLSRTEAATLIDTMKKALGQTLRPPRSRRRPDRDQARAYGTAGRRHNPSNEIQLVDSATLALLDDLRARLGWTPQRLDSFLRSRMSPARSGAIRTLPEANRVIWALKNMIRSNRRETSSPDKHQQKRGATKHC